MPPLAYVLARKFWPGPLTMILKRRPIIPDETTAGLDTVAVRCPNHPVTLAIIREAGVPIAAPSANLSGRPSCTTAQDVLEDMDGRISGVVDGGPCAVGVESTILDLTCDPPRLLRPGGLPLEDLERLIGKIDVDKAVNGALAEGEKPKAPGMKYRHYAPKAPVTVVTGAPEKSAQEILQRVGPSSGSSALTNSPSCSRGRRSTPWAPPGTSWPRPSGCSTPCGPSTPACDGDLRPVPGQPGAGAGHRQPAEKGRRLPRGGGGQRAGGAGPHRRHRRGQVQRPAGHRSPWGDR